MNIEEKLKGSIYAAVVKELAEVKNERNEALLTIENLKDENHRLRFEIDKLTAEILTTGKRFMYAYNV